MGHVTRDLYLASQMPWAKVTWLTGGLALSYLKEKKLEIHEASYIRVDIGRLVESLFVSGELKPSYRGLMRLVEAGRLNADVVSKAVNFDEYDLVVADEFWDLVVSKDIGCRSVFITDFVRFKPQPSLLQYLTVPFINRGLSKALGKFDLRFYVGLEPRFNRRDFEFHGQIFTHDQEGSKKTTHQRHRLHRWYISWCSAA